MLRPFPVRPGLFPYSACTTVPGGSVAAIRLNGGTGIVISGFPVGKPLPSLGHFNQKYLLLGIDGLAGIPQTPRRISMAVSRDRH
jgi:hypothetical protein